MTEITSKLNQPEKYCQQRNYNKNNIDQLI